MDGCYLEKLKFIIYLALIEGSDSIGYVLRCRKGESDPPQFLRDATNGLVGLSVSIIQ